MERLAQVEADDGADDGDEPAQEAMQVAVLFRGHRGARDLEHAIHAKTGLARPSASAKTSSGLSFGCLPFAFMSVWACHAKH